MADEQEQINEQDALVKTSVSLPRYLYDWLRDTARDTEFNSQSAVMIVALSELKGRLEGRLEGRANEGIRKETAIEEIKNASLDAVTAIRKAAVSNENSTALLINLLTTHEELIEEINNQIRLQRNRRTDDSVIE